MSEHKAITGTVSLMSVTPRRDRSVRVSFETPELSEDQMVAFTRLLGKNAKILLQPEEGEVDSIEDMKPMQGKSPSQRLRDRLYVLWKRRQEAGDTDLTFPVFYDDHMDKILGWVSKRIDEADGL